jgi:hypothetical protein
MVDFSRVSFLRYIVSQENSSRLYGLPQK